MSVDRVFPQTVRQLLAVADKHNVTIPADLRKQIDKGMHLIQTVADLNFGDGPTVAEAVIDAATNDRDPLTDPAVQTAVTREALAGRQDFGTLTETARARLFVIVQANQNELVAAFKPVFNEAGATFADARETLTGAGFTEPNAPEIMRASLPIATASIQARDALQTMEKVQSAINMLLMQTGGMNGAAVGRTVQTIDTGNATRTDIRMLEQGRQVNPWLALAAGYTISLATPSEVDERVARANDAADRQAAEGEQAFKEAWRIHH